MTGYVIGQPTATNTVLTLRLHRRHRDRASPTRPRETGTARMLYVQVTAAYRSTFGLQTNPSLHGPAARPSTGALTAYFSHGGPEEPDAR